MYQRAVSATVRLVRAAVVAALYAGLALALPWISFGPVQFRVPEAFTILPLLMPESVVGLTIGCFIANILGPGGWIDACIGGGTTFIAAVLTYFAGRLFRNHYARLGLGVLPPIILNAITVPFVLLLTDAIEAGSAAYWFTFATVLAGQCICILGFGIPLYFGTMSANKALKNRGQAKQNKTARTEADVVSEAPAGEASVDVGQNCVLPDDCGDSPHRE